MASLVPIAIIATLILLNGLFVAAEFAIVAAPRAAVEQRAAAGNAIARIVRHILADPIRQDRYIATAQLGITSASLGLGMYGEHILAGWLAGWLEALGSLRWVGSHTLASIVAVTVLTYLHVVIGEMVPKSLALQRPERVVLWITPIMRVVQVVIWPVVVGLSSIGNGVLRLFGIRRQASAEHIQTADELRLIVQESGAGGLLRKEPARVVQELLDFGKIAAGAVMVPRTRVAALPIDAPRVTVRQTLRAAPHTRYPIYDGGLDQIVGVLHIKDLLRRLPRMEALSAEGVRPIPFIPATQPLDEVLKELQRTRSHMAVVMDEHGGTAGIVTLEDLSEEIVGEIGDSDDVQELHRDAAGQLHAQGTVRLEQVGEALGLVLGHDEVDSVSGLVIALLGRPPVVGDVVAYDDVRFEVTAVEGHGVRECKVLPLNTPPGEASGSSISPS